MCKAAVVVTPCQKLQQRGAPKQLLLRTLFPAQPHKTLAAAAEGLKLLELPLPPVLGSRDGEDSCSSSIRSSNSNSNNSTQLRVWRQEQSRGNGRLPSSKGLMLNPRVRGRFKFVGVWRQLKLWQMQWTLPPAIPKLGKRIVSHKTWLRLEAGEVRPQPHGGRIGRERPK